MPAGAEHGRLLGGICRKLARLPPRHLRQSDAGRGGNRDERQARLSGGVVRLDTTRASIVVQAPTARRQIAAGRLDAAGGALHRPRIATGARHAPHAGRRDGVERRAAATASIAVQVPAARRQVAAERLDGPAAPPQTTDRQLRPGPRGRGSASRNSESHCGSELGEAELRKPALFRVFCYPPRYPNALL
jgi:hypothetical protein